MAAMMKAVMASMARATIHDLAMAVRGGEVEVRKCGRDRSKGGLTRIVIDAVCACASVWACVRGYVCTYVLC
jgi:hypothetical protein